MHWSVNSELLAFRLAESFIGIGKPLRNVLFNSSTRRRYHSDQILFLFRHFGPSKPKAFALIAFKSGVVLDELKITLVKYRFVPRSIKIPTSNSQFSVYFAIIAIRDFAFAHLCVRSALPALISSGLLM